MLNSVVHSIDIISLEHLASHKASGVKMTVEQSQLGFIGEKPLEPQKPHIGRRKGYDRRQYKVRQPPHKACLHTDSHDIRDIPQLLKLRKAVSHKYERNYIYDRRQNNALVLE